MEILLRKIDLIFAWIYPCHFYLSVEGIYCLALISFVFFICVFISNKRTKEKPKTLYLYFISFLITYILLASSLVITGKLGIVLWYLMIGFWVISLISTLISIFETVLKKYGRNTVFIVFGSFISVIIYFLFLGAMTIALYV